MIERLSGRPTFAELHARGTRTGRGPVRLVSCVDFSQRVRIGYAIPRSVGSAVVRNRLRRRLRAVLAELDNEADLPGGNHLVRVSAPLTDWSHAKLRTTMADLMQRSSGMASQDLDGDRS
ncbi:MAG: ribonuclease P protein component [Acidimicrobiales bacterium]